MRIFLIFFFVANGEPGLGKPNRPKALFKYFQKLLISSVSLNVELESILIVGKNL